jgi:hypothetical protein
MRALIKINARDPRSTLQTAEAGLAGERETSSPEHRAADRPPPSIIGAETGHPAGRDDANKMRCTPVA